VTFKSGLAGRRGSSRRSIILSLLNATHHPAVIQDFERDKFKGANRTDFVLSAENTVITLGTVAAAPFFKQLMVLSTVALLTTIGVYGLVAAIVKLDDLGLWLQRRPIGLIRSAVSSLS
jgi:predicted DNA repair protein MutK